MTLPWVVIKDVVGCFLLNVDIESGSLFFFFFQELPDLQRKCLFMTFFLVNLVVRHALHFLRTKGWDPVTGQYSYMSRKMLMMLILTF